SATYTRAVFTGTDANFSDGERVPYAPAFVARNDSQVGFPLACISPKLRARVGAGFEAAASRVLPGGRDGMNVFELEALAGITWRELELTLNGMNLLGLKYYDAQYVYAAQPLKGVPVVTTAPHVLVAPPTSVFLTLAVHLDLFEETDARNNGD